MVNLPRIPHFQSHTVVGADITQLPRFGLTSESLLLGRVLESLMAARKTEICYQIKTKRTALEQVADAPVHMHNRLAGV